MTKLFNAGHAAIAVSFALVPTIALAHGKNDKVHQTETYDLADFDEISVSGAYDLEVTVGEDFGITISGHAEEMENLRVEVKNSELQLGKVKSKRIKNTNGVQATITMPRLSAMSVAGVAKGNVSGIDAEDFELDIAGVGELKLNGTCKHLEANVAGVGEIKAKNFKCDDVHVSLAGVGEAEVYANKSVDVSAMGVGEVNVWGKPEDVTKNKGLMSKVNIK